MSVFRAIIVIMKYSNGPDTTSCQIRYLKDFGSSGIYRQSGRAWIAKSMHCFCNRTSAVINQLKFPKTLSKLTLMNLIFIQLVFHEFILALLLESNDYQSDEDIDEEEGKDNEENHIEDGNLLLIVCFWATILPSRIY